MRFSPRKFKIHRKNARYTQVSLAKRIGVHERTIQNWEGGCGEPSITQTVKLMSMLGLVSIYSLIEDE